MPWRNNYSVALSCLLANALVASDDRAAYSADGAFVVGATALAPPRVPPTRSPAAAKLEIEAYLERLQDRLRDVTICGDDSGSAFSVGGSGGGGASPSAAAAALVRPRAADAAACPAWWRRVETQWRRRYVDAERGMLERHAKLFGGELLPEVAKCDVM